MTRRKDRLLQAFGQSVDRGLVKLDLQRIAVGKRDNKDPVLGELDLRAVLQGEGQNAVHQLEAALQTRDIAIEIQVDLKGAVIVENNINICIINVSINAVYRMRSTFIRIS